MPSKLGGWMWCRGAWLRQSYVARVVAEKNGSGNLMDAIDKWWRPFKESAADEVVPRR